MKNLQVLTTSEQILEFEKEQILDTLNYLVSINPKLTLEDSKDIFKKEMKNNGNNVLLSFGSLKFYN